MVFKLVPLSLSEYGFADWRIEGEAPHLLRRAHDAYILLECIYFCDVSRLAH